MYTVTQYSTMYQELGQTDSGNTVVAWNNINNALKDTSGYSDCTIPSGAYAQNLFFHGFKFNIPSDSNIKTVKVEYCIRKTGSAKLTNPVCYFSAKDFRTSDIEHRKDLIRHEDSHVLGDQFEIISFSFNGSFINSVTDSMGIALIFSQNKDNTYGTYEIDYARITINYDAPQLLFSADEPLTFNKIDAITPNPLFTRENNKLIDLNFVIIPQKMSEEAIVTIDKPVSFDIRSGNVNTEGKSYYDSNNQNFHIIGNEIVKCNLKVWAYNTGVFNLKFINEPYMGTHDTWTRIVGTDTPTPVDTWDCIGSVGESIRYDYVTASFHIRMNTPNADETFDIFHNGIQASSPSCSAKEHSVLLNTVLSTKGVTQTIDNDVLILKIDSSVRNKDIDIYFDVKYIMTEELKNTISLTRGVGGKEYSIEYFTGHEIGKTIESKHKPLKIIDRRSVTKTGEGFYCYPCTFDYYDSHWTVKKPTLRMRLYNELNYIGPVKLKHGHYKPSNTTKDNLLKTTSKNFKYLGKEGVTDETIALNIKLPPKDIATLQSLVKYDMPVPINTNSTCFDGDPLNHRGWVELYSISNITRTNSKWYDCDIGVSYLTHNLNTRFNVVKGSLISKYFLPKNFKDTLLYGDNLNNYFFLIPENGHYIETTNPLRRNMFVLNNKEVAKLVGRNYLNSKCEVDFNWDSIRLSTVIYNDMSRIVRILSKDGTSVFEYEWFDFNFDTVGEITCRVIARVMNKGAYDIVLNREINCHFASETQPNPEGSELPDIQIDTYGSKLRLSLDNNLLSIVDEGASGKELYLDNIELEGSEYTIATEFKNNNTAHTESIVNYLSYHIQELEATDSSSATYKDLLVSPFPIMNKQLNYVRESEDGLIYYFHNDDSESTFMMNPYFMYQGGVDLQTSDGISIIDLDNSYQTVYIVNGLIKVGINRYNGIISLHKYNNRSHIYDLVNKFQLTKYDDVLIQSYSNDKIQLKVSDTLISVWRGRPYIQVQHPTEDILFLDEYDSVYAETVGVYDYNSPRLIQLQDNTNLLPICVGSDRKIKADCIKYKGQEIYAHDTEITITGATSCGLTKEYTVTYDCNDMIDSKASILIDGVVVKEDLELDRSGSGTFKFRFSKLGVNKLQIFIPQTRGGDYGLSNTLNVTVNDDGYLLKSLTPSELDYGKGQFKAKLTYAGTPKENETVWIRVNGIDYEKTTNSDGIVILNNNLLPNDYPVVYSYTETSTGNKLVISETIKINPMTVKPYTAVSNSEIVPGDTSFTNPSSISMKKSDGNILHISYFDDTTTPKTRYNKFKGEYVILEINGVNYIRICNADANCFIHINLQPGTYDLKILHGASNKFNEVNTHVELVVTE